MQINPIQLQKQNKFIHDYRHNNSDIMKHFDYAPYQSSTYQQRVSDLKQRTFDREELTKTLRTMNQQWDAPKSTYTNIERLNDENSVVVIGGQQAGLLTGPMYTINKIISIIQFARQQETALQIPVIPVFWIAGEDHDFAEINHIFMPETSTMKKYKLLQRVSEKWSVSSTPIEETYANQWVNRLFEQLNETEYTKMLYQTIKTCLEHSTTYVDFFASVIYQLFQDEGIVLMDSANPEIRRLESKHFVRLIEKQPAISEGVYTARQQLMQKGYTLTLEVDRDDAHLFYHHHNDRVLLTRNDAGDWVGKQDEVIFTTEELVKIAENTPELLSNNVVTRPVMQELLFPSLAFIGGPGEVSYWSVLKPAFHEMDLLMPPVLPRLSFTYIERHVQKVLTKYAITAGGAVNYGVEQLKGNWLASQSNPPIQEMSKQIKLAVDQAHLPLRTIAKDIRADLGDLAEKNLYYLHCDIEYLEGRMMKALEEKYERELSEFDIIGVSLHPGGGLQERMWNPLVWMNEYGIDFIKHVTNQSCSFENEHYLVYI